MKKNKKIRLIKRTTGIVAGVILAGGLLTVGTAYRNAQNAANNMYAYAADTARDGRNLNSLLKQKKAVDVMLIGSGHNGQADAVMLLAVNPQTNSSRLVSIPKDQKMASGDSISDIYAKGGVSAAETAIHNTDNTPIDAYVSINVTGLKAAVNKIGGITVNGQHMNGDEAVNYARGNGNTDDYSKTVLPVLQAILSKAGSFKTLFNNEFLNELSGNMQTDLNFNQLTQFGLHYGSAAQNTTSSIGTSSSAVESTINNELK